jgi:hypothetical protein
MLDVNNERRTVLNDGHSVRYIDGERAYECALCRTCTHWSAHWYTRSLTRHSYIFKPIH